MIRSKILDDLERFADIDSDFESKDDRDDLLLKFSQRGELVRLRIDVNSGRAVEERDSGSIKHGSYRGLLMSSNFGNIRRLVDSSLAILKREAAYVFDSDLHLPIVGALDVDGTSGDTRNLLAAADAWLRSPPDGHAIRALVIDGPAGIGKTHLIRRLVVDRARSFGPGSAPPILHVQSRGKKLSTLDDVLAGTLNALRIALTNEQVPVLVRNGLLHLAIDGFDELADPAGYETAWGSVVDLVDDMAGYGALILAGRDTFLNVESVKNAVVRLNTPATTSVHLRPLKRNEAVGWLETKIDAEQLSELRAVGLLDEGSYALRPLFIHELSRLGNKEFDKDQFLTFPLASLVGSIVSRESKLIEAALRSDTAVVIHDLIVELFKEVARFMADAESDSIDLPTLDLIAQMVFEPHLSKDEVAMMRHRISAIALLEQDGFASRRRFPHSEIQDFFMSKACVDLISEGSIPKSIRRNIFGVDFLETFHDVMTITPKIKVDNWIQMTFNTIRKDRYPDRTNQNLAAMLLATANLIDKNSQFKRIENQSFDELCFRGTSGDFELAYVTVSHLDARGADISKVKFIGSSVASLLADESTRIPTSFPEKFNLHLDVGNRSKNIFDPLQISEWKKLHTSTDDEINRDSDQNRLLEKICRVVIRQHWIREIEEDRAGRLLLEPSWHEVRDALEQRGLLRIRESVAAGGPRSRFFRVERAAEFLDPKSEDLDVMWIRSKLGTGH